MTDPLFPGDPGGYPELSGRIHRREQHADAWKQVFDLAQAVEDVPAEAIAAAAMLKPGQHVMVSMGGRYFEAKRPAA